MPARAIAATAGAGSGAPSSLRISWPTRSALSRAIPSWPAAQAARPSASIPRPGSPYQAVNRKKRRMRR